MKNEFYYLWADYKWPLLAGLVVLVIALYSLVTVFTKKETILSVMLIDCHTDTSPERMETDFLVDTGQNPGRQQAEILTSLLFSDAGSGSYTMTSFSRFLSDIGSEKLDVCGMLEEDFIKYDNSQTWLDLATLLDEDLLDSLDKSLVVRDGRVIGIYTDGLQKLSEYGCYTDAGSRGIIGVIYNSPHKETAAVYLQYLSNKLQIAAPGL